MLRLMISRWIDGARSWRHLLSQKRSHPKLQKSLLHTETRRLGDSPSRRSTCIDIFGSRTRLDTLEASHHIAYSIY